MVSYIFLQARMSSRRLPGKVLFKLKNKTVLEQAVSNLKKDKIKKENYCPYLKKINLTINCTTL